jgi:hypothetical protein
MTDEKKAAVYVAWVTFKNATESLVQGIPNQIDRTTFPGLSGGVQSQLFSAFKFLGLMTEDDKPTADLHALAIADESKRKEKLKQILQQRYATIFALDLTKATPKEVADKMGEEYGVTGDTKDKCLRFFMGAVQYVGIPVSRFLKGPMPTTSSNGGTKTKRRPTKTKADTPDEDLDDDQPQTGTSRIVLLKSGGTLTLAASIDLFKMSPSDRTFVFSLIDKLDSYEKDMTSTTP